jgi:hypothetical protein
MRDTVYTPGGGTVGMKRDTDVLYGGSIGFETVTLGRAQ